MKDTMQPIRMLSDAAAFFFAHAGYSYMPGEETPEAGRTRCAEELAAAESLYLEAHRAGPVSILWEPDEYGFNDYAADRKAGRLAKGIKRPETIESAAIVNTETADILAVLGGIWDADANYRRVIRAELALECADVLHEIITTCRGK